MEKRIPKSFLTVIFVAGGSTVISSFGKTIVFHLFMAFLDFSGGNWRSTPLVRLKPWRPFLYQYLLSPRKGGWRDIGAFESRPESNWKLELQISQNGKSYLSNQGGVYIGCQRRRPATYFL